ncbi:hypothetical protein LOAG_12467 [Loa loa]|uniref:Uncharacterized protein n=1 Tax=Loa loa TaxID=7209 RepID=A0A1S0TMM7_LOALO|nr:hypothetical protein LOAG_12467 [Loa loa]EFO16043.2 hypothetical protein LOAG_12467 [Loa loa]
MKVKYEYMNLGDNVEASIYWLVYLSNGTLFHFQREKTARQVWTPQSKFEGVRRIMVYFLKNDGTPAPPTGTIPQTGNAVPPTTPAGGVPQAANTSAANASKPGVVPNTKVPTPDAKDSVPDAKGPSAAGK